MKKVGEIKIPIHELEGELIMRLHVTRGDVNGEPFSISQSGSGLWLEFEDKKYLMKFVDLINHAFNFKERNKQKETKK